MISLAFQVADAGLAGASHHAVVPNVNTRLEWGAIYPKLADDERKLFDAIARSYLAAIGPNWIYDRTEISVQPKDRKFAAVRVVNVELGWREAVEATTKPCSRRGTMEAPSQLPSPESRKRPRNLRHVTRKAPSSRVCRRHGGLPRIRRSPRG